jgi:hypothetical protein
MIDLKEVSTYNVLVDVEDLQTRETVVLLDHLRPNVHSFVVCVTNARTNVLQIQLFLPFLEPVILWIPMECRLLRGYWLLYLLLHWLDCRLAASPCVLG